jgi:hypothetical protein
MIKNSNKKNKDQNRIKKLKKIKCWKIKLKKQIKKKDKNQSKEWGQNWIKKLNEIKCLGMEL